MTPRDRAAAQRLGALGETLVADWLTQQGANILAQRWHCRWGEIDVVALWSTSPQALAFVEVKSRRQGSLDATGRLAITPAKQRKLWRSGELFLAQHPQYAALPCRFDVALVAQSAAGVPGLMQRAIADGGYQLTLVEYLPNAFEM